MIIMAVVVYFLLAAYEFIPLYKQKLWKDFWIDIVLWSLSFTAAILLCLNVKIPSPERPIREFITYIFGK